MVESLEVGEGARPGRGACGVGPVVWFVGGGSGAGYGASAGVGVGTRRGRGGDLA